MKRLHTTFCSILFSMAALNLVSCLDAAENEYRVTVPTFATVTHDDAGNVRLYLDEGRGIIDPSTESADIKWGDAVRVMIKYDLPIITSGDDFSMETTRFKGIVRSAVKIDTVAMADVTGLSEQPAWLGNDTLLGFSFHAYWGYLTMQAWTGNNFNFDMTCSYDRNEFDGENLYLKLHYAEKSGTWNNEFLQTVSTPFPDFLTGAVTADSLNIVMTAPVWYNSSKDSVYTDTVAFKISRHRLTQPTYSYATGGYGY